MSKPAARIGDFHICPLVNPGPTPHVGGAILPPGCPTVLVGGVPAARVGDMAVCVGPPDSVAMGSPTVLIGGLPAARMGDTTAHGGTIVVGLPTVLIGDTGPAGAGSPFGQCMSKAKQAAAPFISPDQSQQPAEPEGLLGSLTSGAAALLGKLGNAAKDAYHRIFGETYNNGITIKGSKDYRQRMRKRLDELGSTPSGANILKDLDAHGKQGRTVTIEQGDPGDFNCRPTGLFTWTNAFPKDASLNSTTGRIDVRKPGKGTSSLIQFNDPDFGKSYNYQKTGNPCFSTDVVLGHELLHAVHNAQGHNLKQFKDPTDPRGTSNHEEAQTIGRGAYASDSPTENTLRQERGYSPPRNTHFGYPSDRHGGGGLCP